jgi:hypothetical protein
VKKCHSRELLEWVVTVVVDNVGINTLSKPIVFGLLIEIIEEKQMLLPRLYMCFCLSAYTRRLLCCTDSLMLQITAKQSFARGSASSYYIAPIYKTFEAPQVFAQL